MKISVATTSIHDCSRYLRWLQACDPEVLVFVAVDRKTPKIKWPANAVELSLGFQERYKCKALLGENTIELRNTAILEALRAGADAIVLADDDNLCLNAAYFADFEAAFTDIRLQVTGRNGWFDPGRLLSPDVRFRGFPHQIEAAYDVQPPTDLKVGLAGGIVIGDPDIGAVERIAKAPIVHNFSELLRNGIVVDNNTWTVTNSQNTAVLRQFAPCMLTCPQFGRYADIFASLVCQRVMREHGYAVHIGLPAVWQQRNEHDLVKDLQDEIFGMAHIVEFAEFLDAIPFPSGLSVMQCVSLIYMGLRGWRYCPAGVPELAEAWLSDVEGVL